MEPDGVQSCETQVTLLYMLLLHSDEPERTLHRDWLLPCGFLSLSVPEDPDCDDSGKDKAKKRERMETRVNLIMVMEWILTFHQQFMRTTLIRLLPLSMKSPELVSLPQSKT